MHAGTYARQVRRLVLVDAAGILHREAWFGHHLRRATDPGRVVLPEAADEVDRLVAAVFERTAGLDFLPDVVLASGVLRGKLLDGQPGRIAALGLILADFGEPIDGLGPLPQGEVPYPLKTSPPPAHARGRVGERLDLGVRSMNVFTTTCRGQRLGIFAGSGVGKSVLLSMLAKEATCDAVVVGLIGERGREVREFVEETLGEEGLRRAVVASVTAVMSFG